MEVDDMFGENPEEEVVEEEVPVTEVPESQEPTFFSGSPAPSSSTQSIPVATGSPAMGVASSSSFSSNSYEADEDTSAYKAWKAKHEAELEEKSAKEQKAREASRTAGRKELERLLAEHNAKVEKNKAANLEAEKADKAAKASTSTSGDSWEKVSSYMSAKVEREGARDTSRYRDIVTKSKHT